LAALASEWWTRSPLNRFVEYSDRTKEVMSQVSKNIVLESSRKQKGYHQIVREILAKRQKTIPKSTYFAILFKRFEKISCHRKTLED
jgi:hypothetical protein